MRVTLRLELDAAPDAVWELLHDPRALGAVLAPLLTIEPVAARRLPASWTEGDHRLRVRLLGLVVLGEQRIRFSARRRGDVRIVEDAGGPESGVLGLVSGWRHRMAVSPLPGRRTLYRDRLDFSAGVLTPLVWPGMWLLWRWRARGIRRAARMSASARSTARPSSSAAATEQTTASRG